MKKFLLLFLTLTCAAVAQVSIDWGDVDKTGSSLAHLATRSASDLNSGTLPDGRFPATLPALSGVNLTALNASNIASGTLGAARLPTLTLNLSGTLHTSPVTFTAGVGTATLATQAANLVFAGPASGAAAAPTFRTLNQADTQAATAANRTGLASRSGVAFGGATGARGPSSTLTNQNIGTFPFSVSFFYRVPSVAPSAGGIIVLGQSQTSSAAAYTFGAFHNGSDTIVWILRGANPGTDTNSATHTGLVAAYGGKWVHIVFVRPSSGNPVMYVNGVAQSLSLSSAGAAPTWQGSITSTWFTVGYGANADCAFGSTTLYNVALTPADVQEIYELGGGVPAKFQFGSQANLDTGNFSFESDTASPPVGWANAGNHIGTAVADGSAPHGSNVAEIVASGAGSWTTNAFSRGALNRQAGKVYRLDFSAKSISGNTTLDVKATPSGGGSSTFTLTTGWQVFTSFFSAPSDGDITTAYLIGGAGTFRLDNVQIRQVGAIVHLPVNDQLGFQVRDASTNGLHAERTVGTFWTESRSSGRQTLTYTFAHSAISSTAATTTAFVLPPNTVLREVQLNRTAAFDGGTALDIGISGTPTKFVNATSVAGTGFTRGASSSLVPESASATTTVFVKKNQATTTGSVTLNFIIEAVGSPTQ